MTIIHKSALLPYSCEQVFALVNDVQSYPQFMDGCKKVNVLKQTPDTLTAELVLGKAGFNYSFTTHNVLVPPEKMEMHLVDGPFSEFDATWTFHRLNEHACKAELIMHFEFSSSLLNITLRRLFETMGNNLVASVCKRAEQTYGAPADVTR